MNIVMFFVAVVGWGLGYLAESGYSGGLPPNSKILYPPRILFYLCGAPKSNQKPKGAMVVGSFRGQILGICAGIYGLVLTLWNPFNVFIFLFGLITTALIPYIIT